MKLIPVFLLSVSLFGSSPQLKEVEVRDAVILGGGVGALTSALYLSRADIQPVVIEGPEPGGLLTQSQWVQNWPGESGIKGEDLIGKIHRQVQENGAEFLKEEVLKVDFSQRPFKITLRSLDGEKRIRDIYAKTCIIAMGTTPNFLGVPGESGPNGYWGRGISNCAICDGTLYRGQTVGVVGGGDAAILEAVYLSKIAKKVHLFVRRDVFRATEVKRQDAMLSLPNVEVHYNTQIEAIRGDGEKLTGVLVKTADQNGKEMQLDGLFLAIGSEPNTKMFKDQLELDAKGYIVVTKDQEASVEGVYAIGDITLGPKQAITAASDGCKAALQAQQFLAEKSLPKEQGGRLANSGMALFPKSATASKENVVEPSRSPIEIASAEQFDQEFSGDLPVVVDFYATWCGPCKHLSPIFEESARTLSGRYKFLKVNVDTCPGLASRFQVRAMPTLIVFNSKGEVTDRKVGSQQIASYLKGLESKGSF